MWTTTLCDTFDTNQHQIKGICIEWDHTTSSGLIECANGGVIHVDSNAINCIGMPSLLPYEPVEFNISGSSNGLKKAVNVRGPQPFYFYIEQHHHLIPSPNCKNLYRLRIKQFDDDIQDYFMKSRPNGLEMRYKDMFYKEIVSLIQRFNQKQYTDYTFMPFMFGSQQFGVQTKGSDIDLAIKVKHRDDTRTMKDIISKSFKKQMLKKLLNYMRYKTTKKQLQIRNILNAKCPIITLRFTKYNIKMDISVSDGSCESTKDIILSMMTKYMARGYPMRKMIVFIKYWSKSNRINNAQRHYLNSFGFMLMFIKYIQCKCVADGGYNNNNMCSAMLIIQFWSFYVTYFEAKRHCINIMSDSCHYFDLKSNKKDTLQIVDPANKNNNVTSSVRDKQYKEIINLFKISAKQCKTHNGKKSLFSVLSHIKT